MAKSWNGGRGHKTDNERTRVQKLSLENKELRRQITFLRKKVERLEAQVDAEPEEAPEQEKKESSKDRTCFRCKEAKLRLVKYFKQGVPWYVRRCPACKYQTRGKKFTDDVKD